MSATIYQHKAGILHNGVNAGSIYSPLEWHGGGSNGPTLGQTASARHVSTRKETDAPYLTSTSATIRGPFWNVFAS